MSGFYLAGLLAWGSAFAPGDSLYGTVRDGLSRSPLPAARVELIGRPQAVITDADGGYALPTLPAGPHRLRVTRSGYDTLLVDAIVGPGQSLRVDLTLHRRPTPLPPLEVSADPPRLLAGDAFVRWTDSLEVGLRRYGADALGHDPLAASAEAVSAVAGGALSGLPEEFPSAVHLRGGSADQNLVLLDGLPVYGLMHAGGTTSLFSPGVVSKIDVHTAGRPAGLGGRLSSTVALSLRPPGGPGTTLDGGIDGSAAWQTLSHTLAASSASLLLSGRRSYRGVLTQAVGENGRPDGFTDYLARASLGRRRDRIDLYFLAGRDQMAFPARAQLNAGDNTPLNRFGWANHTAGLVWDHRWRPGRTLAIRAWHAGSTARIAWLASLGASHVHSALRDAGGSVELMAAGPSFRRTVGVSGRRLAVRYDVGQPAGAGLTGRPPARQGSPLMLGAWIDEERRLGKRITVGMGLRAAIEDRFGPTLEPRVSGRWTPAPHLAILVGYNRAYQSFQSMRNEESLLGRAFGADLPVLGRAGSRAARADQLSAGLEHRVGRTTVRLDAYARRFDHLAIVSAATAAPFATGRVPLGSGEARGIELDVTHYGTHADARLAAGVSGTRRRTGTTEFSPGARRGFWLSAGLRCTAGTLGTLRIAGSYASGAATSVVAGDLEWQSPRGLASGGDISGSPQTIVGGLNASMLPAYFRVDLGVSRDWSLGGGAHSPRLSTSLTLTNLLDRRNPLGLAVGPDGQALREFLYPGRSLNARMAWHF